MVPICQWITAYSSVRWNLNRYKKQFHQYFQQNTQKQSQLWGSCGTRVQLKLLGWLTMLIYWVRKLIGEDTGYPKREWLFLLFIALTETMFQKFISIKLKFYLIINNNTHHHWLIAVYYPVLLDIHKLISTFLPNSFKLHPVGGIHCHCPIHINPLTVAIKNN